MIALAELSLYAEQRKATSQILTTQESLDLNRDAQAICYTILYIMSAHIQQSHKCYLNVI